MGGGIIERTYTQESFMDLYQFFKLQSHYWISNKGDTENLPKQLCQLEVWMPSIIIEESQKMWSRWVDFKQWNDIDNADETKRQRFIGFDVENDASGNNFEKYTNFGNNKGVKTYFFLLL